MADLKLQAATEAIKLIRPGQVIGLGAGSTMAHLVNLIAANAELAKSLVLTSSSFKTTALFNSKGLGVRSPAYLKRIDIYFDGCDQFDAGLNALKCGGGIHTGEKILAAMADEFILLGDVQKFTERLDNTYPLVLEILPQALQSVIGKLAFKFQGATLTLRTGAEKDGAVISDNGNYLLNINFTQLPELDKLNCDIKMIPGVVEHSLFYQMATKAIIAGPDGVRTILPKSII